MEGFMHRLVLLRAHLHLLEALPELEELTIVSDDDGLFSEDVMRWNEGCERRFLDSPG